MKRFSSIFFIAILYACKPSVQPVQSVVLESEWQVAKKGDSTWYKATVPGSIYTDLLANKQIKDPFVATNEMDLQWIENEDWQYKTTFYLSATQLANTHVELEFEGLDTYATVILNGVSLAHTNNMFRIWRVAIKNVAKEGANTLEIHFTSPINYNKAKVQAYPHQLPSGNEAANIPVKVSPFTRKAAYQFGWDWGPRFVGVGIWKNVKINTWNSAKIQSVFVQTDSVVKNKAHISYSLDVNIYNTENKEYTILFNNSSKTVNLKKGSHTIKHSVVVENPKLWWPKGMGKPQLHTLKVSLLQAGNRIDTRSEKYGIRTIDLVQEKDSVGTSFYFKINEKPLFIKGANYIPQDVFLERVSDAQYETLIKKAVQANMNMLRVWGGGIYEKDTFYDLCDKYGLLVWQDFMFAGSMYPVDTAFASNVAQEVQDNVTRLRNHPSIALWCGNNEIEVAWKNWGWQQQFGYSVADSIALWQGYKKLFQKVIPETLKKVAPNVAYVNTSPLSNWGKPVGFNHGTMHYWGVWHGKAPFSEFKKNVGRFMVEYGFQSFPEMKTIRAFAADSSLHLNSKTMRNRQKSYIGNGLIEKHTKKWFGAPNSFSDFVEKSQKTQAVAMQMAIQSHVQKAPHCMGTLFWQLNDCWPGPSWSVIDYYGNNKLAYATVQENYKTVVPILNFEQREIEIINTGATLFNGRLEVLLQEKVVFNKLVVVKAGGRLLLQLPANKYPATVFDLQVRLYTAAEEKVYGDKFWVIPQ